MARVGALKPSPLAGEGWEGGWQLRLSLPVGALAERREDKFQDTFGILENLVVPDPDDMKAPALEKPRPPFVPRALPRMLPAIDLDHQLRLVADEIDDIRPKRRLPAKPEARKLPPPEPAPKPLLRLGEVPSQSSGIVA